MSLVADDLLSYLGITSPTVTEDALAVTLVAVANEAIAAKVYDTTPQAVQQATLMYAARLWKRKASPEGTLLLGDGISTSLPTYDADVEALLAPYRHWKFGK